MSIFKMSVRKDVLLMPPSSAAIMINPNPAPGTAQGT